MASTGPSLRPDSFAQNFSEGFWLPGILAAVAAAALTGDGHHGQIYQLTGSRAISFGEAADLIGKASGRAIRDGDATPVSDGVARALGRPPRPFEDYVTEAAATGQWNRSPDA